MITNLVSLASRQVWPHVLVVAYLKPKVLILLHSSDLRESEGPAKRLHDFFRQTSDMKIHLELVPSDEFGKIKTRFFEIAASRDLSPEESMFHFTGGNKLMATAAYEWSKQKKWKSCYLERGNTLYQFEQAAATGSQNELKIKLDDHLIKMVDPIQLLNTQLDEALVQHEGELLTLNEAGRHLTIAELNKKLKLPIHNGYEFSSLLNIENKIAGPGMAGDNLEYATAFVALKHGVPMVRRSIKFKSSGESKVTESEIDVIFHWRGRLWMVDCKAKSSGASKLNKLKKAMKTHGWDPDVLRQEFDSLKGQLDDTEARLLKEDIQQISEIGGLLGSAIAVRLQALPEDVMNFARSRRPRVEVICVAEMQTRIPQLLS